MIDIDIIRNIIVKLMVVRKLEILVDFKKFFFFYGDVGLWEVIFMFMSIWEIIIIFIRENFFELDSFFGL